MRTFVYGQFICCANMASFQWFLICFCVLGTLARIDGRPDGSGGESGNDNNNDNGAEQWANDNNGDSSSQNNYQQNNDNEGKSSNSYSNNHNNNGYQNQQTLAKVLPQPQQPQKLDEIYNAKTLQTAYATANRSQSQQQILLYLKFPRDFGKVNPRDPKSLFHWTTASSGLANVQNDVLADNAAFKLVGGYNNKNSNDEYGSENSNNNNAYGGQGYLQLTSLPFTNNFYQEGFVQTKQNFTVGNNERILGRMKLSCKTIDTDKGPFNSTEVSRPYDDPRPGGCDFQMTSANGPLYYFYFIVINKSVWAVYAGPTFIAKRKVGIRERYDSIVDAGMELDKRQNVANYYLNGYKVWTISAVGAPPPDDGITNLDLGSVGTPTLVNITQVQFSFGTGKCLDESDPYTPDNTRLVRILPADNPYYSSSTTFYDPTGAHTNIDWGQGAVMKAYKLLVIKAESRQLKQSSEALTGVYGSSSSN